MPNSYKITSRLVVCVRNSTWRQLIVHSWVLGYHVVGIDYFFGDYFSDHLGKPGFQPAVWAEEKLKVARDETPRWIEEIRKIYGA
jgi:hypothetical protein